MYVCYTTYFVTVLLVCVYMCIYMYTGGAFSDVDTTKAWHPTVGIDAKVRKHNI